MVKTDLGVAVGITVAEFPDVQAVLFKELDEIRCYVHFFLHGGLSDGAY